MKIPNNQVQIADSIRERFYVQVTHDNGSVIVQEPVSLNQENQIREFVGNQRIGNGVQEGSLWINGNE